VVEGDVRGGNKCLGRLPVEFLAGAPYVQLELKLVALNEQLIASMRSQLAGDYLTQTTS